MNNTQKYIVLWTLNYMINDPVLSLELRRMEKGLDHRVKYSLSLIDGVSVEMEKFYGNEGAKDLALYFLELINTLENLNLTGVDIITNLSQEIKGIQHLNDFLEQLNIPTYEITSFRKQKIDRRNA